MSEAAWPSCVLGEGIQLISGRHIQASGCNTDGFGMPYLTGPEDFPYHRIQATKFVSRPDAVCEPGDILLVVKGSGTGKMIRADKQYCISRQLMAIRSAIWSNCFLEHFIRACEEYFSSAASGLIPGISRIDILETPILIPPLPQQRKIARILTTLDNVITQTEALIAKYQAIKQGLMHDLFTRGVDATGKLRPPQSEAPELYKQSERGWIPREWEVSQLGDCVDSLIDGPFGSNLKTEHYVTEPCVRVVRLQNISNSGYDDSDPAFISHGHANFLSRHKVVGGDVLIASLGDENYPPGRSCLYPSHLPPAVNKADCFRLRCNSGIAVNAFVSYALNSSFVRQGVKRFAQGVTLVRVNGTNIKKVCIKLPSVSEQQQIVERLDAVHAIIETQADIREKYLLLKTGLMQDLLTGKVRVNAEV